MPCKLCTVAARSQRKRALAGRPHYKDKEGNWQKGGSYRIHDLPVLAYLIQKAHTFALDRREQQSVPF